MSAMFATWTQRLPKTEPTTVTFFKARRMHCSGLVWYPVAPRLGPQQAVKKPDGAKQPLPDAVYVRSNAAMHMEDACLLAPIASLIVGQDGQSRSLTAPDGSYQQAQMAATYANIMERV